MFPSFQRVSARSTYFNIQNEYKEISGAYSRHRHCKGTVREWNNIFRIKAMDLTCAEYGIEMDSEDRREEGTHEFAMKGLSVTVWQCI